MFKISLSILFHIFSHYGYNIHKKLIQDSANAKYCRKKYFPSSYHVKKHGSDKTIVWNESNVLASKYNTLFHSHGKLAPSPAFRKL